MRANGIRWWFCTSAVAIVVILTAAGDAQQNRDQGATNATKKHEVEAINVRGSIYLISGAGANITASVGPSGVFLVDSGSAELAGRVLEVINRLGRELNTVKLPVTQDARLAGGSGSYLASVKPPKPIRYIVDTSGLPDHIGGNARLAKAGRTYTGGNVVGDLGAEAAEGAGIYAHEKVLQRLAQEDVQSGLPTLTYFGSEWKMGQFFNGDGIRLVHFDSASTDGDSIVYFRGSDIISSGDVFSMETYPIIDVRRGGGIKGVVAALNYMVNLAIPEFRTEGGTFLIPGHGRVADDSDLTYYRDMVTIIRDRVQDMIKRGMTLEQVKAAKPTEDWDPRFGRSASWTPDMFVEAVYKSLSAKK